MRTVAPMAEAGRDELFRAIDAEAASPAESKESRLLYDALAQRRDQLKAETSLPEDKALSEKILAEARTRSAQISAARGGPSGRAPVVSAGIPAWLWAAWILAIAAVILAYRYFA